VIEIVDFDVVNVYTGIAKVIDAILLGGKARPEERRLKGDTYIRVRDQKISLPMRDETVQRSPRRKKKKNR